jgi:hypothetical protein
MYRLLAAQRQVDERQNQRIHAVYTPPEGGSLAKTRHFGKFCLAVGVTMDVA